TISIYTPSLHDALPISHVGDNPIKSAPNLSAPCGAIERGRILACRVLPDSQKGPRVLVVGCGGIGGVLSTLLLRAGVHVTIASTNDAIRAAWQSQGPRLDGKVGVPPLPAERVVRSAAELSEPQDIVLVAVQPPQVDEVGRGLAQHLAPDGRVVCLSNGLCEDRLARYVGPDRVVGAVVAWGARMLGPGDYVRTSAGGFRVGTLSGARDA